MFDVVNGDEARKAALEDYREDVAKAYSAYTSEMRQIYREHSCLTTQQGAEIDGPAEDALKSAAAKRGAMLAAASKRARRTFVAMLLDRIQHDHDLDLTMTTAAAIFRAATGFAPAKSFLVKRYGTSGRTASDKSRLTDQESDKIDAIATALKPHVASLLDSFPSIRSEYAAAAKGRIQTMKQKH